MPSSTRLGWRPRSSERAAPGTPARKPAARARPDTGARDSTILIPVMNRAGFGPIHVGAGDRLFFVRRRSQTNGRRHEFLPGRPPVPLVRWRKPGATDSAPLDSGSSRTDAATDARNRRSANTPRSPGKSLPITHSSGPRPGPPVQVRTGRDARPRFRAAERRRLGMRHDVPHRRRAVPAPSRWACG